MNIEIFREACLNFPFAEETLPFDQHTLVYKVGNKMFALIGMDKPTECNLKCEPLYAEALREEHEGIKPGFHMNKTHWNTVSFTSDVNDKLVLELLKHSYDIIWEKLPKKTKEALFQSKI